MTIQHVTWTQALPRCLAGVFSSSGLSQFKHFPAQPKSHLGKGLIVYLKAPSWSNLHLKELVDDDIHGCHWLSIMFPAFRGDL